MKLRPWTPAKITIAVIASIIAIPVLLVAAFVLYIFAWFHAGALFHGDGQYRTGVGEAAFQVAFPIVDLSRPGQYRYTFTRLGPSLDYSAGFRILDRGGNAVNLDEYGRPDLPSANHPAAVVEMSLTNERHEKVFREVRRLSDWNWLRNMAEVNSKIVEVPIGEGSVRIERIGVGPDGGWGTHFTPRWLGRYTLEVKVLEPDPRAANLRAEPVIEGYVAWP